MNSPAPSTWVPICLPKFNPLGFVNAYISFLRKEEDGPKTTHLDKLPTRAPLSRAASMLSTADGPPEQPIDDESGIALVCISAGGSFETIRGWCDSVSQVASFTRST